MVQFKFFYMPNGHPIGTMLQWSHIERGTKPSEQYRGEAICRDGTKREEVFLVNPIIGIIVAEVIKALLKGEDD